MKHNPDNKTILFLSAIDFKEKSIQVIRKTPEYFFKSGWNVEYITVRDNSRQGTYFYENEINPQGVNVLRLYMPLTYFRDRMTNHLLLTILTKIAGFIAIFKLAYFAKKLINSKKIDVLYGYEFHGVLAIGLLRLMSKTNGIKIVSRFQGTWLTEYLLSKNYLKLILNFDALLALKLRCDLCIMTNDGTQGNIIFNKFNGNNNIFRFWINGVDEQKLEEKDFHNLKEQYKPNNETIILSVSRLESWKRVDRIINIIKKILETNLSINLKYLIVGEGVEMDGLRKMVQEKNLNHKIYFIGGINNDEVKKYLNLADIFISTYDLSNVGNPLLEAIRANKVIFTLNNGDTNSWIKHKYNGFIYDINSSLINDVANDILLLIKDQELKNNIIQNIKVTEAQKLWTWDERMNAEEKEIRLLVN